MQLRSSCSYAQILRVARCTTGLTGRSKPRKEGQWICTPPEYLIS